MPAIMSTPNTFYGYYCLSIQNKKICLFVIIQPWYRCLSETGILSFTLLLCVYNRFVLRTSSEKWTSPCNDLGFNNQLNDFEADVTWVITWHLIKRKKQVAIKLLKRKPIMAFPTFFLRKVALRSKYDHHIIFMILQLGSSYI